MYKTHFKRWKLRKYSSACEKDAVAEIHDLYRRKGLEAPDISLDGLPVQLHLVRRRCRQNKVFDEVCESLPWQRKVNQDNIRLNSSSDFTATCNHRLPSAADISDIPRQCSSPRLQFQTFLTTEWDPVEHILILATRYFEWHFNGETPLELAKRPSTLISPQLSNIATHASSFWKSVVSGLDLLIAGQPCRAFQAFDQGCALAENVLREQRRGLLKLVYLLFSDERWQGFPEICIKILEFFSKMSTKVLGELHPLSVIARLCRDPAILQMSNQRIHELLVTIFRRYAQQGATTTEQLRRAHRDAPGTDEVDDETEREAKMIVLATEASHGPQGDETRFALRWLAHIYIDQGRYEDAEAVFLDVVERAHTTSGPNPVDESNIFCFQNLACLSDLAGDLERAETQWELAFDGAKVLFGMGHYETRYCRHNLDCVRLRRGLIAPTTNVHDFLTTCALRRRPSLSAAAPPGSSNWASHSRLYLDGDLWLQLAPRMKAHDLVSRHRLTTTTPPLRGVWVGS
jgi:hypothetical protein